MNVYEGVNNRENLENDQFISNKNRVYFLKDINMKKIC